MDAKSLKQFVLDADAFYRNCSSLLQPKPGEDIDWRAVSQLQATFQRLAQTFNSNRAPLRMIPPSGTTSS